MSRLLVFFLFTILLLSSPSCLISPPEPAPVLWMKALDSQTNTPIRNMHAATQELLIISDDGFIRLGPENKLKERRALTVPFEFFSNPVLSDNTFSLVVRTAPQGGPVIEIHLVATPGVVFQLPFEDLKDSPEEIFAPASKQAAQYTLAYNDLGTQLLVPVVDFTSNAHTFFLIDIELDFSKTKFVRVEKRKRIDIPEFPAAVTDRISNIVFEGGYFYVITLDGTFRIGTDGTYEKVLPTWLYDVFQRNDTLFASERGENFFFSTDNGNNWTERDSSSQIKFAEVIGDRVVSQNFPGALFTLSDGELEKTYPFILNEEFPDEATSNAYAKLLYFYDSHYLVVQKEVYFSCGLRVEDN